MGVGRPKKTEATEKFQNGLWIHKYEPAGEDHTQKHTENLGPNERGRVRGHNRLPSPGSHPKRRQTRDTGSEAGRGTLTPYTAREGPLLKVNSGTLPPEDGRRATCGQGQGEAGEMGSP